MKFDVIGSRQQRQKLDGVYPQVYRVCPSNIKDYRSHIDQYQSIDYYCYVVYLRLIETESNAYRK